MQLHKEKKRILSEVLSFLYSLIKMQRKFPESGYVNGNYEKKGVEGKIGVKNRREVHLEFKYELNAWREAFFP